LAAGWPLKLCNTVNWLANELAVRRMSVVVRVARGDRDRGVAKHFMRMTSIVQWAAKGNYLGYSKQPTTMFGSVKCAKLCT